MQLGPDGELVAMTAAERFHNTKLRRAQVMAAGTEVGVRAMREVLVAKLERQVEIATRIHEHAESGPMFGHAPTVPVPDIQAVVGAAASLPKASAEINAGKTRCASFSVGWPRPSGLVAPLKR